MKKRLGKIIFVTVIVFLFVGALYIIPKALKLVQVEKSAMSYVSASTVNTFKDTKTTVVYDKNGDELCEIKSNKNMYYVSYQDIPQTLAYAFIAVEDRNFFEHSGIDYKAIIRAAAANQKNNQIVQGASTITQQLARNIFLSHEVTWERKVEEIFIAWGLEKKYSKEQILEFYLNNVYFGNGFYGVEAAAKGYFDKSVSELTLSEQAFIAAIPNGPSKYNPFKNFDNTIKRRNIVLKSMYDEGYINENEYNAAQDEEIILNPHKNAQVNNSVVTYVRHCATESLMIQAGFSFRYNFSSDEDKENYQELYDAYYTRCQQQLLSGGFTVYTSFDMDLQEKLQAAIDENLAEYTELSDEGVYKLQGAATCIDNETGNVAAIVGSRSQDFDGYTLNRAYQSYRQPGSTIKPLSVYTPYLQLGNTPDTIVYDEPFSGGPSNVDNVFDGEMTLREAVKRSKNTVAWKIYQEIQPNVGVGFLLQMGFKKVWKDIDYPAGALGGFTYGATTEEMAGAYAALANDGVYRRATCIIYITDAAGKVVADERDRGVRVYTTAAAQMMTDMLKSVMEAGGTGANAAVSGVIIAGKTGTTNSNYDRWFCGYSRYYTAAVWVGYDYPKNLGSSYKNVSIFKQFMEDAHKELPKEYDSKPTGGMQDTQVIPDETETQTDNIETESLFEEFETKEIFQQDTQDNISGETQSTENGFETEATVESGNYGDVDVVPGEVTGDTDSGIFGGDIDADISDMGDK